MAFPSSTDAPGGTAAQGTSLLSSIDHALDHRTLGSAVVAIETKIGLGSGTPTNNAFLKGTGNGTSAWSSALDNLTLGTPRITGGTISGAIIGTNTVQGGTINNAVIGTPTVVLGSDAAGDLFTRSEAGTMTRIASGSIGQVLKGNGVGTVPTWGNAGILGNTVTPTGTQTTTATSGTPMANGTLSIPITAVSNVLLFANAYLANNATGAYAYLSITLGGTLVGIETNTQQASGIGGHGISVSGMMGSVAIGTYSAIIKFRGNAGTVTAYQANLFYTSYPV